MGTLNKIDGLGDSRIEWNADNPAEVEAARDHFNKLKNDRKYRAYREDADGGNREIIHEFDPRAGRIIMSPQSAGG